MLSSMEASVGERVRARFEALGMKQVDVALSADMGEDVLSRCLAGKRQFKLLELATIADLVHTSVHWLITGERDPFELKLSARHDYDRDARAHIKHDWKLAGEVAGDIALTYAQVNITPREIKRPDFSTLSATDAARRCVRMLEGQGGSPEGRYMYAFPSAIENAFGIDVFVIEDGRDFKAYSAEANGNPFIVARTDRYWFRVNWNLAHELGHILRGDLAFSDEERDVRSDETWANAFAAELLAPAETVGEFDWANGTLLDLARLVAGMGISTEVLRNRLSSLRIEPQKAELLRALETATHTVVGRVLEAEKIMEYSNLYQEPRFPGRVVKAHGLAVEKGEADGQLLAWMLGAEVQEVNPRWAEGHSLDGSALAALL
jgi:Zn-dependent peptidase ImmA (M78 family)